MKILHVINSFEGGGAEKLTLQLHESLLKQEIASYAVSLIKSSADIPNTHSLECDNPYQLSAIFKLFKFLQQPKWKDLDIIHVHLFPSQLYTPLLIKILGLKAKLITTEHSTFNYRRKLIGGRLIDLFLYAFYTKIVCISHGTFIAMQQWLPLLTKKLVVIYNGIDLSSYYYKSVVEQKCKTPVIISVGRLVKIKNYESALQALSKIRDKKFEYWILGSGVLESSLKNLTKTLNLEHKVKFLGFRNDIPKLLKQADIFLQTSHWEGFGLAVVEAMAAGLPVIVSDVPGVREIVNHKSVAGFAVNPTSQDDIAEMLKRLLDNPKLREEMGKKAYMRAQYFDIQRTISEYTNLYYSVALQTPKDSGLHEYKEVVQ